MDYFLITTRGLEDIAVAELRTLLPAVQLGDVAYRRVAFAAPPSTALALLGLRCPDDVFIAVAAWQGIGKSRRTLEQLSALAAQVDLRPALALCAELRPVARPVSFAVSASFVGRRNYSSPEIKLALAAGVRQRHNWIYSAEELATGLSLRLFIEHEHAWLGVRLGDHPLHQRPYKQHNLPGSLKPPIAAAMLHLAELAPGLRLLDPLCGAGTIVIEAALMGAQAQGGDSNPQALEYARANLLASGANATFQQWDAQHLPLDSTSIDCAATNLPFGRQVRTTSELTSFYAGCLGELDRVLRPGRKLVLLTSQLAELSAALQQHPALKLHTQREISLYGQNPTLWTIVKDQRL